jgi:hypothetical protein
MDANFFLVSRLDLITSFYRQGAAPFLATMAAITDETGDYANPPYSEDSEPPYQLEWEQAQTCLLLLGATCISSLAGAMQVFLDTLVQEHGDQAKCKTYGKKDGWWAMQQRYFAAHELDFAHSGADVGLLTDVVLARNSVQHPKSLTNDRASYRDDDLKKLKSPFFLSEEEAAVLKGTGSKISSYLFQATIEVDEAKLTVAVGEMKKLGHWLQHSIWKQKADEYQERKRRAQ